MDLMDSFQAMMVAFNRQQDTAKLVSLSTVNFQCNRAVDWALKFFNDDRYALGPV